MPKRMTSRAKGGKVCVHYWHYDHTLYQNGNTDGVLIHRQCAKCGTHQIARSARWRNGLFGLKPCDLGIRVQPKPRKAARGKRVKP